MLGKRGHYKLFRKGKFGLRKDTELDDSENCLREQQLYIKLKGARESLLEATLAASVSDVLAALMKSRQSAASGGTVQ